MIPRVLHHIWVGPRSVPGEWIAAWREMHPTWEHRLWREADLAGLEMVNRAAFDAFMEAGTWHGASDIARVEILRKYGGVYVDIDSRPRRSFEGGSFMAAGFFAAYEPTPQHPGRIANGTIGSEARHPILDTYARLVSEMTDLSQPWDSCGGTGLTAAILVHRQCCKPVVLPERTFYPTDVKGQPVPGSETVYCEHFWSTTNHTYPARVVILVPRRVGDGREATWAFVRQRWESLGWPIFEGHHEGLWSAAAARNDAAARAGDWDVAVFLDSDIVMFDPQPVQNAVKLASRTGHLVRPHDRCWMFDEAASARLMKTGVKPTSGASLFEGPASGGIVVVPRKLWDLVGGYDERFRGWGYEDLALVAACWVLGGVERTQGEMHHLWHPTMPDRDEAKPEYQACVALHKRYEAARRPAEMRALIAERPSPPKVAIMVPRRAGDPVREHAWEYTRKHWETLGWPIFEGHHDEGPFNASAARNAAARLAGDWDVAVFVDADTVMLDHASVRSAVDLAASSGQFVRPFTNYWMLDQRGAASLMETGKRPVSGIRRLGEAAHGGVNVIPRKLWDAIGGYDERFKGWGSEDTAVELAGRVIGGFAQIPGDVYHLWHPKSADRDPSAPAFQANVALRGRYEAATTPAAMRTLIAERSGPKAPTFGAVVITNGRRECIARTVPSLEAMVGPFAERLICDDSGDPRYVAWLTETFPGWRVQAHAHIGHGPAVHYAMVEAAKLRAPWIFWSEDDLVYQRPVDLAAIARVMEATPHLKQMSLKRQSWFPLEKEAGPTVIDRFDPSLFVERESLEGPWISHRTFYTLNPHLVSRDLLRVVQWPAVPDSEKVFGARLFRDPRPICGIWGSKADAPWVLHQEDAVRVGTGYDDSWKPEHEGRRSLADHLTERRQRQLALAQERLAARQRQRDERTRKMRSVGA